MEVSYIEIWLVSVAQYQIFKPIFVGRNIKFKVFHFNIQRMYDSLRRFKLILE